VDSVRDEVIPAKAGLGLQLRKGQTLRITDIEGKQVADVVFFNANDVSERLSCNNTRVMLGRWLIGEGDPLFSDEANRMATITADRVGVHHLSGGCCNQGTNSWRYGVEQPNCLDNLTEAAAPFGIGKKEIPGAFCVYMNVIAQPDGTWEIHEPHSVPGDYIDIRADMDLIVAISNCPQERNPCNGFKATPLSIEIFDANPGLPAYG
jgi:uncharacterized protein YcgI (DUF1989 family)